MSDEDYKIISFNAKKNSIGKDKKDENKREVKKTLKKIGVRLLIFMATAAAITLINSKYVRRSFEDIKENSNIEEESEFRNYHQGNSEEEIDEYGKNKTKEFLEEKGFIPKNGDDGSYIEYNEDDWKKLGNLNPYQVYGIKKVVDRESFDKIMKSMNYKDYDDYLLKNNYVTSNGNPDYVSLMFEYQDATSQEMANDSEKGETKQWK